MLVTYGRDLDPIPAGPKDVSFPMSARRRGGHTRGADALGMSDEISNAAIIRPPTRPNIASTHRS